MARRIAKTPAGEVIPVFGPGSRLIGLLQTDTDPFALAVPAIRPLPMDSSGAVPVNVVFPAGVGVEVLAWLPGTDNYLPMVPGVNYLRQSNFGLDTDTSELVVFFAAFNNSGLSGWVPRRIIWSDDEGEPEFTPISLVSTGVMTTSAQVNSSLTLGPNAVWAGSVQATDSWIETSPTNGGAATNQGDITTVPNLAGSWIRGAWSARGPNEAGVIVTLTTYTPYVQIIAESVPKIETGDVTFFASFFRPDTQATNFAPEFSVSGGYSDMQFSSEEPAVNWYAVIAGPGGGVRKTTTNNTAGQFTSDGAAKRGRFRLRHRPNSGVAYSPASDPMTVPVAVDPDDSLFTLMRPSDDAIRSSLQSALVSYTVERPVGVGGGNANINDRKWDQLVWVMASLAGVNTTFDGIGNNRNPRAYAIQQFQSWCSAAGTTAPACRSGYHGQHEARVACFFAMCRLDPNIWNAAGITDVMRNRARWLVKSLLFVNAFIGSSTVRTYYPGGFGSTTGQRNFQAWTAGNNNVPNFSSPPRLIPHVCAAFMALDSGNPNAAADALAVYDRAAHFAEGEALGGMVEARLTFSRVWTTTLQTTYYGRASTMGNGPSDTIQQAVLRAVPFRLVGEGGPFTLAQPRQAFAGELTRIFNQVVRPGPLNVMYNGVNMGRNTVGAPYNNTAQRYGVFGTSQTDNALRGCLGRPTTEANPVGGARGSGPTIYESIWTNLPDKGAIGRYMEFDTVDGAVPNGGPGPFVRSAPTYGISGLGAITDCLVVMIYYGIIEADDTLFDVAKARWRVGIRNFAYAAKYGYRGYAKGGIPSDNNVDWTPAYVNRALSWAAFMGMNDRIAVFWGFPVFPTND